MLIDQATSEPIKNVFKIGWETIILNIPTLSTAITLLLLLNIASFMNLMLLNIVLVIFSGILVVSAQIYIGRTFYEAVGMNDFASTIREATVMDFFKKHIGVATGSYIAWITLFILPILVIVLFLPQGAEPTTEDIDNFLLAFIPFIVIMLIVLYVQPLVQANVIVSNTFKEGFRAVMTIFSKKVWTKAFTRRYFSYLTRFGLIIFATLFLLGLVIGFTGLSAIDIKSEIVQMSMAILNTILSFLFMIITAIFIMLADKIAEPLVSE